MMLSRMQRELADLLHRPVDLVPWDGLKAAIRGSRSLRSAGHLCDLTASISPSMLEACDAIARFLVGMTVDVWAQDEVRQSAVVHRLIVIGEAAARLSPGFRSSHGEVDWAGIIGFRNLVVNRWKPRTSTRRSGPTTPRTWWGCVRRPTSCLITGILAPPILLSWLLVYGQNDRESGAVSLYARHADGAVVQFDRPLDYGQPQAGAQIVPTLLAR